MSYRTYGIDVKWYKRDQEIRALNTGLQDVWHRLRMVQQRLRDSGFKHWLTGRVASMSAARHKDIDDNGRCVRRGGPCPSCHNTPNQRPGELWFLCECFDLYTLCTRRILSGECVHRVICARLSARECGFPSPGAGPGGGY
ncbi:hypothetical protein RRG08_052362 [Elysia crispata]|uniref:Uncharacterized protein n=1 Tax=Elysia crispata TaxID=231223 RepID=A0AAE1DUJ6_9GAST|nr:hypothetical protein RRG08_052362 [Elysia crispata]